MKQKEALHTAARRYLIQRADELACGLPANPRDYTAADRERCARSGELRDFLQRVERATPHPPGPTGVVRDWLLAVVREPLSVGTRRKRGGIMETFAPTPERLQRRAEEADQFSDYLLGLTAADLQAVAPLPYRRTLGEVETDRRYAELGARWDLTNNHWYGDVPGQAGRAMLVLRLGFARRPSVLDALRRALFCQAATRLWLVPSCPFEAGCEFDLELFDFTRGPMWDDVFWTAGGMEWVIFGSHEPVVTLAGDDLVREFRRRGPDWAEGVYRSLEDLSRTD